MTDLSGRVLAVDPGTRRVGIAVSDATGTLASPVRALDRSNGDEATWRQVAELAAEYEVVQIIVGLPRSLSGAEGVAAVSARADAAAIASASGLQVELVDERLTTVSAAAGMRAAGLTAKQQRSRIDAAAAAVLLQGWLDRHRSAKR